MGDFLHRRTMSTFRSIVALATIAMTILLAVTHGLVEPLVEHQSDFSSHLPNKTTHRLCKDASTPASTACQLNTLDSLDALNLATASLARDQKQQAVVSDMDMRSTSVAAFVAVMLLTILTVATPQAVHKKKQASGHAQEHVQQQSGTTEPVWRATIKPQLRRSSTTTETAMCCEKRSPTPPAYPPPSPSKVRFGSVQVRSFARVAGGGGAVASTGPPLGMGWDITAEEGFNLSEYETARETTRLSKEEFAFHGRKSSKERQQILLSAGETDYAVQVARDMCKSIRQQRAQSNEGLMFG